MVERAVVKAGRAARRWALALVAVLAFPQGPTVAASNPKQTLLRGPHRPAASTTWPSDPARRPTSPRALPVFVPGHIVAKFDGSASARSVESMAREVGAVGVRQPSYADFLYVELAPDVDPVAAAAALSRQPGVLYAEPDPAAYALFRPNDPFYRFQWHLQKLDMERAWDINQGATSDIVVAVLDTGVAFLDAGAFAKAPDLRGTRFVPGYDFIWDDADPVDLDGHGTHVTGTIAQSTNNAEGVAGMAFNVSVMPVKVLLGDIDVALGAPFPFGLSTLARGIRFAVDNGARVLNMSLGGFAPSTPTQDALREAVARGAFITIAAGNSALCDTCPPGIGPNPVIYPAQYAEDMDGVIAVGALDFDLERAVYSSFHSYVEIAAPGGDTEVDRNGDGFADGVLQQTLDPVAQQNLVFNQFSYEFFQGTSQATPHVAGFAALLMSQGIRSPVVIEAAIKRFATDVDPPGRDSFTGYGVLNPRATLLGLGLAR